MKAITIDFDKHEVRFRFSFNYVLVVFIYPMKKEVVFKLIHYEYIEHELGIFTYKVYDLHDSIVNMGVKNTLTYIIKNVVSNRNCIVDMMGVIHSLYISSSITQPQVLSYVTSIFIDWLDVNHNDLLTQKITKI